MFAVDCCCFCAFFVSFCLAVPRPSLLPSQLTALLAPYLPHGLCAVPLSLYRWLRLVDHQMETDLRCKVWHFTGS